MGEVVLAAQVEPQEGFEPPPGGRVLPGTVSLGHGVKTYIDNV